MTVTYKFTCSGLCYIELSDGIAELKENVENGVVEYTRTIPAQDKKGAEEDIVVFQYVPKGVGSVMVEVSYDDNVDDRYNERNTIYFASDSDEDKTGVSI